MNKLHEKGLTTDGAHLEFLALHTNVLYQPDFNSRYYNGINPYAFGFAVLRDIQRMCSEPTAEDKKWFPQITQASARELILDAVANYRDERLRVIKPNTIIRELAVLSSIINHARREWGLNIINPVAIIKKPSSTPGRNRILSHDELNRLLVELEKISLWYKPLTEFALETAMRRGELLSLTWANINFDKSVAFLPHTKNGDSRYAPLSNKAVRILRSLPRDIEGRVFPLKEGTVSTLFLRATRRAKVEDFHFHDLIPAIF